MNVQLYEYAQTTLCDWLHVYGRLCVYDYPCMFMRVSYMTCIVNMYPCICLYIYVYIDEECVTLTAEP